MRGGLRRVVTLLVVLLLATLALPANADVLPNPAPADVTAQLSVTKSAAPTEVGPGDTIVYTINVGCSAISDIGCRGAITTDTVPAPLQVVSANTAGPNSAATPVINGQDVTVTWTQDIDGTSGTAIGMADNTTSTISITARVPNDISYDYNDQTLTNTATAEATNAVDASGTAPVHVTVPFLPATTAGKTITPATGLAAAGTPVQAALTGSNDSNGTVDSLVIQDPSDPTATPNPFTYLGFTGFGDVTPPAGTTSTGYELYVGGTWIGCPGCPNTLPAGVTPDEVLGTRVTFTGAIPAGATGSVDLDLATTDLAAGVTADTTVTDDASSQVALDGQTASDTASDTYVIQANDVTVSASKSFDPTLVIAGQPSTVTIGGTNQSPFPIDSMTVSEPASGSFPDDYTFAGFAGGIDYPDGATGGTVTYQPSGEEVAFDDGATPAPPSGGNASVTSFTVTFTGSIATGGETSIPFTVDTDPDATGLPNTVHNDVGVQGENNGATGHDTAGADLYIYNERVEPYVDKRIRPSQIIANPGEVVTVSLTGGTTELPNPPATPDGTTGDADRIVIQDPLDPVAPNDWWNAFDLTAITQTPIPADASLTVYYYDTTDDTWKVLTGPVPGPEASFNYTVPADISAVAGGVRFEYDYTGSGDGFAPGTDLAPNFTSSLRADGRYDGATPPYNTDPDNPDTVISNCAQSTASSPTDGVPDGNAAMNPADCPTIDILPPNGQGVGDLISKRFGTSSSGGVKSVIARSGDTIPSTLSWSTGGYSNLQTVDVTDVAHPETTAVADSVFDAFDLTRVQPISATSDPHLTYDRITEVQLWNGTAWVDATNDPCPAACDGTFPGMDLTSAEQASTLGVRLTFAESDTHRTTPADPPVGSGVARSIGDDRDITLVWQVRDTKRSDGSPALAEDTYNLAPQTGIVRNTANATGYPAGGGTPVSTDDADDVTLIDVPITMTTSKSWAGGPLAVPAPGTPANEYPLSQVSVTATNTTPARVDQMQITDPAPGSTTPPATDPFDYFRLNNFAAIVVPSGATTTTVTLTCPDASTHDYDRTQALALTPATMPCDVVGVRVLFDGRIVSAGRGVVRMDMRLRAQNRSTGEQITADDSPIGDVAQGIVADVDAIQSCPPAAGARYACAQSNAAITLAQPTYGVEATKSIAPATQKEGDDSPVVVTMTGQNTGTARSYMVRLTDDDPTFWNAMDLVGMDPSWSLPTPVQFVQACYKTGGTFTDATVAADDPATVGGDWTCEPLPGGGPPFQTGDLTLQQAIDFIDAAAGPDVHGVRFSFMANNEIGWQNPANPLITVPFQVQRRTDLRTGGPVPTTRSDQVAAPGETDAGVFGDTAVADGESVLIGPDDRLTDEDSDDATYTYVHDTVSASVNKSPEGEVQPGQVIPFTLTFTNTGEAPITDPVFTDQLPTDAEGPLLIFDPDSDPAITSPYSFALSGDAPDPPNGDPLPTDQDDITITQTGQAITFAMPPGTVLEPGQTYTITIDMMLRPGLTPGDQVTNTATIKGDEPFDSCSPNENADGACWDDDTVSPIRVAALSTVKKVKADVPVDEPGIPEVWLDRDVIPSGADVPDDYCDSAADADGFYRSPCVPVTYPGDTETWRMTITNSGTLPISQLVEMDNLPTPGDTGVIVNLPRGSEWSPTYADSLELIAPGHPLATMTTYYSTSSHPCTADLDPLGTPCPAGDWIPISQAPSNASVAAVKFVVDFPAGNPFAPGQQVMIQGKTRTTPSEAADSTFPVAWNTAATGGVASDAGSPVSIPATEGRKVGVTYPTGPIRLQKVVTGDGAPHAPDSFRVQLACTMPAVGGQPAYDLTGLPEVTLVPGDPPVQVDNLPWGAQCTATEADQGQTSQTIGTATVGGPDDPIGLITVTNEFDTGAMTVTKAVDSDAVDQDGNPIAYGPFTLRESCTFLGDPVWATGYSLIHPMVTTLAGGATWTLTGLPVGATCTTTEPGDAGAASTTIAPATVTIGGADRDPAAVQAVTVTNHYDVGSLRLRKFVPEEAEPYAISQGPFTLHVTCVLTDPSRPDGAVVYDDDVVLQGPQPLETQIDDLPTGAVCTVTEPDPGAATAHTVVPSSVTIGDDTTVRVVVSNLFGAGSLTIDKSIAGPGADLYGAGPFEVSVTCTYTDVNGAQVPLATPGGATRELSADNDYTVTYQPLLLGSTCHVAETRTGGATDTVITDADGNEVSEVTIDSLTEALTLGITNTFDVGSVRVHKVVKGDGSGPFTVRLACTYDVDGTPTPVDIPGGADRVLTDGNDLTTVYDDLPTGASCTLTETKNGGANATTITPNAGDPSTGTVTVGDSTTVGLRVVNRFVNPGPDQGPSSGSLGPGSSGAALPDTGANRWTTYALLGGGLALVLGLSLLLAGVRRGSSRRR